VGEDPLVHMSVRSFRSLSSQVELSNLTLYRVVYDCLLQICKLTSNALRPGCPWFLEANNVFGFAYVPRRVFSDQEICRSLRSRLSSPGTIDRHSRRPWPVDRVSQLHKRGTPVSEQSCDQLVSAQLAVASPSACHRWFLVVLSTSRLQVSSTTPVHISSLRQCCFVALLGKAKCKMLSLWCTNL
jgi:hypothetical protein